MKLSLRYFLLICLLLGGVCVPAGFRWYKSRKEKEVERLEQRLASINDRYNQRWYPWAKSIDDDGSLDANARILAYIDEDIKRSIEITERLKKLTGAAYADDLLIGRLRAWRHWCNDRGEMMRQASKR